MTQLSIVVLSFNTSKTTISCLESLFKHYEKEFDEGLFELVVVDNNSLDDSVEKIKEFAQKHTSITLITNKENEGFGKGNNTAVKKARGEFVLFLNSDTQIKKGKLADMSDFMEHHEKAGVVGGKLYNSDGTAQNSTGNFYTIFNLALMLFGGGKLGLLRESPNYTKKIDWVSGAFMMVRKNLFEKLSGFDEHLFMYMEDMEFCYRVKRAGYDIYFYPDVCISHIGEGSSNRSFAIVSIYKGVLYYFKKHKSGLEYHMARFLLFSKAYVAIFIGTLFGKSALSQTYKKAIQF